MVTKNTELGIRQQCCLLQINRSLLYYNRQDVVDDTCLANTLIDIYRQYPVYGYQRLTACLKRQGHGNGKHVLSLMHQMGLRAIYPKPRTTMVNKDNYKYPYVLKYMAITKPHQACQIDITYLRTEQGFMRLLV